MRCGCTCRLVQFQKDEELSRCDLLGLMFYVNVRQAFVCRLTHECVEHIENNISAGEINCMSLGSKACALPSKGLERYSSNSHFLGSP